MFNIDTDLPINQLKRRLYLTSFIAILSFVISIVASEYGYYLSKKPILVVLLFHDVLENSKDSWKIKPQKLDYYIEKLLAKKYKPIAPKDFEDLLNNGFKGKNFLVTFDDGTGSEYQAIEHLYKKYGIKSVLFLVEDFIGRPENISKENITKLKDKYGTLLALHGKHHVTYSELAKRKYDFGKITEESRIKLSEIFNTDIKWISYPFGDYNQRTINELKEKTAIKLAFTIESGYLNKDTDRMQINRFMYLGGSNPDGKDEDFEKGLFQPAEEIIGHNIILLSIMFFFFGISRIVIFRKYIKALKIKMNKQNDL